MDAKDLKTESALDERNNDGSKYARNVAVLQSNRNKPYQDIGSNPLAKVDTQTTRPCAVIGPDRVVPPVPNDSYPKKGPDNSWPCPENIYSRLPEYQHKVANHQNPTRNISPRQTFQENMPRIMVPPTYNTLKIHEDSNYTQIQDRNVSLSKNIKSNVLSETKYCDVPYTINTMPNEQKGVRNPDICVAGVQHPMLARMAQHGWPPSSVNLHSSRPYGAPELYQYPEYPSCAGPRSVSMARPHRTVADDPGQVYSDSFYQEANVRFKPYPNVKDRYPQTRYEYFGNYSNPFHTSPFTPNKYDIPKTMHPHPYPGYPHLKYFDKRMVDPIMDGYQRQTASQGSYNMPLRSQLIHPNYGQVLGNGSQNKMHPFQVDTSVKPIASNKLPYENSNKIYLEYGNPRTKPYPTSDNYYINEMNRVNQMKNQVFMSNYQPINMHTIPPHAYYKKDNPHMKSFDYQHHVRNPSINIINPISQFSPTTIAISPTESNTSNDTMQTQVNSQEDCGYVSQSSTTSLRSLESANHRLPNDYYRRYYDVRYGPAVKNSPTLPKSEISPQSNLGLKDKKQINLRQFIQMWNEGEEENGENINSTKECINKTGSTDTNNFPKQHEIVTNQEQLYVLGLVNVSSEELSKYEHIQTVSKLPENIKGYNNIELLNQFEEVTESSNITYFKPPTPKDFQTSLKPKQAIESMPRPVSPLDVEAKISQSVIHKEVGCNFEIKPCSPKMLNVEIASPIHNILTERIIEKVTNPLSAIIKSPNVNENSKISSCKMVKTQFSANRVESAKTDYSLQDLESNSGVCRASLPRLDNDIELSFPEVNQQFINANKRESVMPTTYLKDLQEILEQSDKITSKQNDALQANELSEQLSPVVESEKEFTKLSKYRKLKINGLETNDNISQIKTMRTDSVIIKNPENPKNYEENMELVSKNNKFADDAQQVPMNLTSPCNFRLDHLFKSNMENTEKHDNIEKYPDIDVAIDFSLNKSDINISDHSFHKNDVNLTKIQDNSNEVQESIDTPVKDQHFENRMLSNSSTSFISTSECDKEDTELVTDRQRIDNNYLGKENLLEEDLKVVTEQKQLYSPSTSNSEIICSSPSANFNPVLYRENYLSVSDNNSEKNLRMKEDKKYNVINETNMDDFFCESIVPHTKIYAEESNITKITASSNTLSLPISSPDKESLPKIESYFEETLLCSPMEQKTEIQEKSKSEIKNLDNENLTGSDSEESLLPHDKPLLRKNRTFEGVNKINQNNLRSNVQVDQSSLEHPAKKINELCHDKPCLKNIKELHNPISHECKGYFSKKLYSPWIQKLLIHTGGRYDRQNNVNKLEIKSDKIVDILPTDSFTADSCFNHMTDQMKNSKEKDSKWQLDHTKFGGPQSRGLEKITAIAENNIKKCEIEKLEPIIAKNQFDDNRTPFNITQNVNNCLHETNTVQSQQKLIESAFDKYRGDIDHITLTANKSKEETNILHREILKDDPVHNPTGLVNISKKESSIEELQLDIVKRDFNGYHECAHNITNIAEKSIQEIGINERGKETTTIKFNQNRKLDNISNFEDNNIKKTIKEDLQPEINNVKFGSFEMNITEIIDNNKGISKDKLVKDDTENDVNKINSIEEFHQEWSKNEFNYNRESNDTIKNIGDSSIKETAIANLQSEIIKGDDNSKIQSRSNTTDVVYSKRDEIAIQKSQQKCTNFKCNGEHINDIMEIANDTEDPRINKITSIESDHEECTDDFTKTAGIDKETTNLDKFQPEITKFESSNNHNCIDNITKIANNKITHINELHPEISNIECGNNHECLDDVTYRAEKYKETGIDQLQIKIKDIQCGHKQEQTTTINNITKLTFSEKETNMDQLHRETTIIESGHNHDRTNDITKISNNNTEETNIDDSKHVKISNKPDRNHECIDGLTEISDNNTEETNVEESQQEKTTVELSHNHKCIDDLTKMADNNKEETNIYEITKTESGQDCKFINIPTKVLDNDKFDTIIDELQPHTTKVECDSFCESINTTKMRTDHYKEETIIEKLQPKITKVECNNYRDRSHEVVTKEKQGLKTLEESHHNQISFNILTNIDDRKTNDSSEEPLLQKCESRKEDLCCTPNLQLNNIHNNTTTNENMKYINEKGEALDKNTTLLITCEEHEIVKQVIDDETKVNRGHLSLEKESFKNQRSQKHRLGLKRSFSDSAINSHYNDHNLKRESENISVMLPVKRKKMNEFDNIQTDIITENICHIIQNNRRNSISSIYNQENVSFCILIDNNCIIADDNEKICYTELSEECVTEIDSTNEEDQTELMPNIISSPHEYNCEYSDSFIMECDEEKSFEESWVEDVACVETVVSDDIAEGVVSSPVSPKDIELFDNNESGFFSSNISEHTDKVKYIYGGKMCTDDVNLLETLYKTPQMDVNKTLTNRECQVSDNSDKYYDKESLEKVLSESNDHEVLFISHNTEPKFSSDPLNLTEILGGNEDVGISAAFGTKSNYLDISSDMESNIIEQGNIELDILDKKTQDDTVHSCESSIDGVLTYDKEDEGKYFITSSSPEVSSTTSEEKSSGILLKITNYKGSRISQINDIKPGRSTSCKYTEKKDYSPSNLPSRPLITKAAKKYIPPLKESIPDLKVKLPLPQQSLIKLKQLKISKVEPKVQKHNAVASIIPKKPKPKFEDVLKSIDEIQFKKHKEKNKKTKNIIPKVVIKKNRNGSHYASTSNKDTYNPDLTGRKWQPWVFIEKNYFIDKMAIKRHTRAIYNHRKNTYVLAEKFRKYKSVNHPKFVISQPKLDNSSKGHLKYTIRLKHY